MISCLTWVERGVANAMPEKVELEGDVLEALIEQTRTASLDDSEGDADEDEEDEDEQNDADMDAEQNEMQFDEEDDDAFEDADSDDDEVQARMTGLGGLVVHTSNTQDPYITNADIIDDEEIEDFTIKPTDNLILVGQTEEEHSRIEAYVYEEGDNNLFVHHDILIGGFPLCMEWLDFDPADPDTKGNFLAVGTMLPQIEVWDLDVVDAVEAVCVLGELPEIAEKVVTRSKKKGKNGKKQKKTRSIAKPVDQTKTHVDAVLSIAWNRPNRNLLASGSADKSVKVWDLSQGTCMLNLTHHTNKVQSVKWNPVSPTVLLTGSYDGTAAVVDCRNPTEVLRWELHGEVESMAWNLHNADQFLTSLDNGNIVCCDVKTPTSPLYTISAHHKAACTVSFSLYIPGLVITTGADKMVKVWDTIDNKPIAVASHETKLGPVYAAGFSPDSPFVVAAGGGKGKLKVWNLMEESPDAFIRFSDRVNALQGQTQK
eukprot:CFRG4176T1